MNVRIDFYKDSGKFYTCIEYTSKFSPFQKDEIIAEAKKQPGFIFGQCFVVETTEGDMASKWLIHV